jgi:hypothetical protein
MALALVLAALSGRASAQSGNATTLFVSPGGNDGNSGRDAAQPFATIARARDEVRRLRTSGGPAEPITIYLRGGLYLLREPLVFTPEDSGTAGAPVTYAAYPGERPVISGGRPVKGWAPGAKGVWTTTLDDVRAGRWYFNQIFVNGELRHRARIPNEGFLRVKGMPEGTPKTGDILKPCRTFEFAPGDLNPNWRNLKDVEVIVYHFWTDHHLPIQSIDAARNMVTFSKPSDMVFSDDVSGNGARYIVENVYEGLDAPGEWYLDRTTGVLSYIPMPGEDMRSVEVIAPVAPALMRFAGEPEKLGFVQYLKFQGLTFQYTNFQLPPDNANSPQGASSIPAAIQAIGLRHTAFEHCAFRNLGNWAIDLQDGCRNNRVTYCELSHLAAGGIRASGGTESDHPLRAASGNLIADNHLHDWGEVYRSAVGVLLMNTDSNTVEHNDIDHGWYTGVSVGWQWGYMRSVSRDNHIEYNHIHHIGQGLLSDMGGIYTLGVSPGTVLRYNHIHDVDSNLYGGCGIYHDEGSTHILTENNLVHDTKFCTFNIHYAKEVTVRNNIFAFGRNDQVSLGRVEPHVSVYFQNNIVYWTQGVLMNSAKPDGPYQFWMGANAKMTEQTSTADSDWNIFFNPRQKPEEVRIGTINLLEWQKRGKDVHSRYVDPMFVDAEKRDFRLRPGSPAAAMGFEEFDVSSAGARGAVGPQ